MVLVLNDFFPLSTLQPTASAAAAAAAGTFLSGRQQFFYYYYYYYVPWGRNSKNKPSFNKTKLEWLLSGAVARRGRAFPSTGRCGGFSLLLHVIIFIFSSFYFSPSIGFHRAFFIRSRRTLFARIPCTGVRLYIYIYVYTLLLHIIGTPHYTHIGILYVYTTHDNNEWRRNPFFSPPLRQRQNVTCVFARERTAALSPPPSCIYNNHRRRI